jgi:hypothetical protein
MYEYCSVCDFEYEYILKFEDYEFEMETFLQISALIYLQMHIPRNSMYIDQNIYQGTCEKYILRHVTQVIFRSCHKITRVESLNMSGAARRRVRSRIV